MGGKPKKPRDEDGGHKDDDMEDEVPKEPEESVDEEEDEWINGMESEEDEY